MQNGQPSCFGKHWDATHPECRGGNDPAYRHPTNGTNRRDQCQWFGACSATTNQQRLAPQPGVAPPPMQQPQIVPAQALIQHRPAPIAPVPVPQMPQQQMVHPQMYSQVQMQPMQPVQVQQVPQAQQQVVYAGNVPYTQPPYAVHPSMVPMNQPMPGAATQSFLMVPEPVDPEVSNGRRLMATMMRSMIKAGSLAVANFMDYHPWD